MITHIHTFHDVEMTRVWLDFISRMFAISIMSFGLYYLFKFILKESK